MSKAVETDDSEVWREVDPLMEVVGHRSRSKRTVFARVLLNGLPYNYGKSTFSAPFANFAKTIHEVYDGSSTGPSRLAHITMALSLVNLTHDDCEYLQ